MIKISNKFFIVAFIVLFVISTALLPITTPGKTPLPAWGGDLDVGLVVLIAFTGITIQQRNKTAPRYDASHQIAIHLFLCCSGGHVAISSCD